MLHAQRMHVEMLPAWRMHVEMRLAQRMHVDKLSWTPLALGYSRLFVFGEVSLEGDCTLMHSNSDVKGIMLIEHDSQEAVSGRLVCAANALAPVTYVAGFVTLAMLQRCV